MAKPDPKWLEEQLARLELMTFWSDAAKEDYRRRLIAGTATEFRREIPPATRGPFVRKPKKH
jgi:hypothetical protein